MRPRIAITTWRRELPTFLGERTSLFTLADEYVRCIREAGATPLLLPHVAAEEVDAVLDVVDGIVVAGGGDVDPASYGHDLAGSSGTDRAADLSELALIGRARARSVPALAICRGMQLVNVAFGGTLRQDIGVPGTDHEPISEDPERVLAAAHPVDVAAGSRLASLLGAGERVVNTIHHQAIARLGDGLQVVASARDGIIEAVETEDWPLIAVQWHPEKTADGSDAPLFAWLCEAAGSARPRGREGRTVTAN